MDSVMDFVNISAIYHATQMRQIPHYQMIKYLKRENVRDVRVTTQHPYRKLLVNKA